MTRLLLVAAGAWVVGAAALFAWPHDDEPVEGRADAVVTLAGSRTRLPVAERLVRDGAATVLVVSLDETSEPRARRLCDAPALRVVCIRAEPTSTRGEARALAQLAERRGWDDLVVVTSDFHVFRARLILDRCLDGRLRFASAPSSRLWLPWQAVKETAKLALALTTRRSC